MASLSVLSAVSPAAEAASQSNALALVPTDAALNGWKPLVRQPHARVRVVRTRADGAVVRLSDVARPAGYVMLGVQFAPRVSVVGQAEVNVARQVIGAGRARAVLQVAGQGVGFEAGLVRTRAGALRWAAWFRDRDGSRRALVVSPTRVRTREWTTVTLATRWNRPGGRASLRINGRVVARTRAVALTGYTASRVNVGLGTPDSRREFGMIYVRRALAFGPDLPVTSSQPGGSAPAVGGVAPAAGATAPAGTAPRATTPTAPRTTTPRTSTPAPAPAPPRTGPSAPPPASGDIPGRQIARVDFENGFAGTSSYQAVSRDRITTVTSPVAQGRYAARFEVRNGDNPIGYGDRAEVSVDTNDTEGQERWYSWAVMFDGSFPTGGGGGWQVVTQFHSQRDGQPPVGFYAENNVFRLQVWPKNGDGSSASGPKTIWSAPVQRNVWYRLQLHVKWSGRDDTGFVELFVNGQPAGRKTYIRTMYPGYKNYTKLGYYRVSGLSQTGVVYIDDFKATQVN